MRNLTVAMAITGLAITGLPAGGAGAQSSGEQPAFVQWLAPEEGARLAGEAVHVKAKVGYHGGVKSWAVEVLSPEGADYPAYGTICEKAESASPPYVNVDCVWDTTGYPNDGGWAQNRPYVVRITVFGKGRSGTFSDDRRAPAPHSAQRDVIVSNPVSAPRGVYLRFSEASREATIRWRPNPEPDIRSYVVQERFGDGAWKEIGQAGGTVTTFTRSLSAPGTYRYQVAALRAAGSGNDTIQSAWSGPATEPRQIVVAEPERPSTTTTTRPYAAAEPDRPADPAPPTDPAPDPLSAAAGSEDPAAPEDPAAEPGEVERGGAALVSPIQPGAPGSVKSGGAKAGGTVAAPAARPARRAEPRPAEAPDTGFSPALPYKQNGGEAGDGDGDGVGRMLVGLPEAIGGDENRQLLVPMAAGLLLFVIAMHALYLSRRALPEAPLDTE